MNKELEKKLKEISDLFKTLEMESNYQKLRADKLETWKINRLKKEANDERTRKN